MTNPEYYLPTTPRDINMTNEAIKPDSQFTEEQLQNTMAAKGFSAFTYMSDLMQRYPMDLDAVRAGRIFTDATVDAKVRRKLIKGEANQNSLFEAYRTRESQNVAYSTVEISDTGFTPSMLSAALAAKVMLDEEDGYNRLAYQFLQVASALLQEGTKAKQVEKDTLNLQGNPELAKYYATLKSVHARAYAVTAINDLLKIVIGENPNTVSFADEMAAIHNIDEEVTGEGSKAEALDGLNLMLTAITNLGFSQVFQDVIVMSDQMKENIGEAALVELTDAEQK